MNAIFLESSTAFLTVEKLNDFGAPDFQLDARAANNEEKQRIANVAYLPALHAGFPAEILDAYLNIGSRVDVDSWIAPCFQKAAKYDFIAPFFHAALWPAVLLGGNRTHEYLMRFYAGCEDPSNQRELEQRIRYLLALRSESAMHDEFDVEPRERPLRPDANWFETLCRFDLRDRVRFSRSHARTYRATIAQKLPRVVWCEPESGETFAVTPEGGVIGSNGEPYDIDETSTVRIAHQADLNAETQAWQTLFGDYSWLQPYDQFETFDDTHWETLNQTWREIGVLNVPTFTHYTGWVLSRDRDRNLRLTRQFSNTVTLKVPVHHRTGLGRPRITGRPQVVTKEWLQSEIWQSLDEFSFDLSERYKLSAD